MAGFFVLRGRMKIKEILPLRTQKPLREPATQDKIIPVIYIYSFLEENTSNFSMWSVSLVVYNDSFRIQKTYDVKVKCTHTHTLTSQTYITICCMRIFLTLKDCTLALVISVVEQHNKKY